MKYFIIAVCLIGAIVAKKGEDIAKTPGCEKYDSIKNIKATSCCKSLPKLFNKASYEACAKECEGKGYCCKSECVLKANNLADASGKVDVTKLKEFIKTAVKDAKYPVDTIVDGCVAKAPKEVEDWKKKHANEAEKKDKKPCANPENISITKCIRRELILNCPDWSETTDCENLMSFAKSCPKYPPRGCDKKNGEGKKGGDKKSEKKQ